MRNPIVFQQLTRARTGLILDQPFFGQLALRLTLVEDPTIPTLAVDGKHIFYNPEFVATLSHGLTLGALAHEVMHCVFDHISRRGDRTPRRFNQAGDYVINATLKDSNIEIGPTWLYNPAYAGMTTDQVYALLPDNPDGGKDPLDQVIDGPPDVTAESDWKIATIQAATTAKEFGKLPKCLARFVEELTATKLDWRALLRQFIVERSKNDYSWQRPNRRFQALGIILPGLYSEQMGEIAIAIDTSGSISQDMLNMFGSEIRSIVQTVCPSKTHVIYCDTEVNHVDSFGPHDDLAFNMHGGGGTAFAPPFDYLREHDIKPTCFVYLTDLYGSFPDEPDYPVMWACTTEQVAPWGVTIPLK